MVLISINRVILNPLGQVIGGEFLKEIQNFFI